MGQPSLQFSPRLPVLTVCPARSLTNVTQSLLQPGNVSADTAAFGSTPLMASLQRDYQLVMMWQITLTARARERERESLAEREMLQENLLSNSSGWELLVAGSSFTQSVSTQNTCLCLSFSIHPMFFFSFSLLALDFSAYFSVCIYLSRASFECCLMFRASEREAAVTL